MPRDMSDTILFPQKLITSLINMYKELPCLWDRDNPNYKIKMKRHEAITKLTELVQQYEPSATRVHVLRKIDSLRACVRREYKRVVESRRRSPAGEVYVPSLWYYEQFSFIFRDEDTNTHSNKTELVSVDSEEEVEERSPSPERESRFSEYEPEYTLVEVDGTPSSAKRPAECDELDTSIKRNKSSTVEDEYDAIGVNVAAKLRHLQPSMRIIAEKLINDVLYQAQVNALTAATAIHTPDPFTHTSDSRTSHHDKSTELSKYFQ